MTNRIKASALVVVATVALSGCGAFDLDVNNPNNLVEASIRQEAASAAVVNGSLSLVSSAVANIWQPYLVASDEMYWIGSRDAWGQLDNGFVENPENEFTDGAFPSVGQGSWMAREAVRILQEHVGANPGSTSMAFDLARAQFYYGIILMVIGEVMEDMAFSDKTEDGQPVSQQGLTMASVIQDAIAQMDAAITTFTAQGETELQQAAMAVRARAAQSMAISSGINPVGATPVLVNAAGADALAVITMAGGVTVDWDYDLLYSSASQTNGMASWINDRKENQIDLSLVTVDAANDITGIALMDPIDNVVDPALTGRIEKWKGTSASPGAVTDKGGIYPPLTLTSTRLMHLILAENALQGGDGAGFTTHINHVRAMDGLTAFSGQIGDQAMLEHTRRVNTTLMGLRLSDMYRFGLQPSTADGTDPAAVWSPLSVAVSTPGELLPITIIERRANCFFFTPPC